MENEQKQVNFNQQALEFKLRRQQARSERNATYNAIKNQLQADCDTIREQHKRQMEEETAALREKAAADIKALDDQLNATLLAIAKEEDESKINFAQATRRWIKNGMMDLKEDCGVSPYTDELGDITGIRIKGLGLDFMIKLHDEFDGEEVNYDKAKGFNLPDEKMARVMGFYRKEINQLLKELGGDPMEGWYWTSTPAEEVFGASNASSQLIYSGTYGYLNYNSRIYTPYQVRVALALI